MQNRIRELRKQKGISMKQLGKSLGLAESTISQYETGKREPDIKTLLKISEYFGVRVEDIIGLEAFDTGEEFQARWKDITASPGVNVKVSHSANGEITILCDSDVDFYDGYKELPEDDKETIRQMVEVLRMRRKNKGQPQEE